MGGGMRDAPWGGHRQPLAIGALVGIGLTFLQEDGSEGHVD